MRREAEADGERAGSVTITVGKKSVTRYAPKVGSLIRERKREEGKCEALGCQEPATREGYCEMCAHRLQRAS
jgi:hypothetical protein